MNIFRRKSKRSLLGRSDSEASIGSSGSGTFAPPTASPKASGGNPKKSGGANSPSSGSSPSGKLFLQMDVPSDGGIAGEKSAPPTPMSPQMLIKAVGRHLQPASAEFLLEGEDIKTVKVKIGRDEPVEVPEAVTLFTTTWNLQNTTANITDSDVANWIPKDFGLYVIAVQDCKNLKSLHGMIEKHLTSGGEAYEAFKYKELGNSSIFIFAKDLFVASGCLTPTRLNDMNKYEIKGKGLLSSATGRGGILAQLTFHNSTVAFLMVVLELGQELEKKLQDLDFVLRKSGIKDPDTNDIGTPALQKVQHVFLLGDFGCKASPRLTPVPDLKPEGPAGDALGDKYGVWSAKRWIPVRGLGDDEFTVYKHRIPQLKEFEELEAAYPPTTRRVVQTVPTAGISTARKYFEPHPSAEVLSAMFDPKLTKSEGTPSYQDRILVKSLPDFTHLIVVGVQGTCEAVQRSSHVPVYATFLFNGMDDALLKRWQIITGNMPVENATRTDSNMVAGVVENFLSELMNFNQVQAENERIRQAALAKMRKCTRCLQPLSLEGGDVDLGERAAFHRGCFTCDDCGRDLLNTQLREIDGKWLCLESFNRFYTCPTCGEKLGGGAMIKVGLGIGLHFHPKCFKCAGCSVNLLEEGTGAILPFQDLDSRPYCLADFEKLKRDYCGVCRGRLAAPEGSAPTPSTKGVHDSCLCCRTCGADLKLPGAMDKMVVNDYRAYCDATCAGRRDDSEEGGGEEEDELLGALAAREAHTLLRPDGATTAKVPLSTVETLKRKSMALDLHLIPPPPPMNDADLDSDDE